MNGGKVDCSRIRDRDGRLALGEDEVRRIWKYYFEYFYNIQIQEKVAVHMCGFDGARRGNFFEGEPIRRTEIKSEEA